MFEKISLLFLLEKSSNNFPNPPLIAFSRMSGNVMHGIQSNIFPITLDAWFSETAVNKYAAKKQKNGRDNRIDQILLARVARTLGAF